MSTGEPITVWSRSQNCLCGYSWQVTRSASEKVSGSKASLNVSPVSVTECMARPRPFRAAHIRERFSKRTQRAYTDLCSGSLCLCFLCNHFGHQVARLIIVILLFHYIFPFLFRPLHPHRKHIAPLLRYACAQEWQIGDTKAKQTTIMICKIEKVGLHFKTHL